MKVYITYVGYPEDWAENRALRIFSSWDKLVYWADSEGIPRSNFVLEHCTWEVDAFIPEAR